MAELHNGLYYMKVSCKSRVNISNVVSHGCNKDLTIDESSSVGIPKTVIWHLRSIYVYV